MKIWDKIVDGAARLASGEPIGSLLGLTSPPADDGAASGPAPDRLHHRRDRARRQDGGRRRRGVGRRGRGVPRLLPGAAGRGEERRALLRSGQARRRGLRDLCAPARGAVSRCAGNPRERAGGPVRHRRGRRPGRRRGGRLSRPGGAHLRPRAATASSAPRRRRWASSNASPASFSASIRWRPTSRSARPGCARCAPIIPTG